MLPNISISNKCCSFELYIYIYIYTVACTGGGGGAQAPAPLRSDAKVPLRSGLCDMNDIVDEISTAAVCVGHQVPGGHHPSCSKKKKKKKKCILNADDHN